MIVEYAYCHRCLDGILLAPWRPCVEELVHQHLTHAHSMVPGSSEMEEAFDKILRNIRMERVHCRPCGDDKPEETK